MPYTVEEQHEIARILDHLAPDISADVVPAYLQFTNGPIRYQIRFEATREALLREFGWRIERIKIYDTQEDNGKHPDTYAWEELNKPAFYPKTLKGKIETMGLTQPGNSDNGRLDRISYSYWIRFLILLAKLFDA